VTSERQDGVGDLPTVGVGDDGGGVEGRGVGGVNSRSAQEGEPQVPGSNASTLSTASSYTEKESTGSSICSDDHPVIEQDIMRAVLYSTRENVDIIHEVFRQVCYEGGLLGLVYF